MGGGKLKLASVTAPAHGTVVISGDELVYTPAAGYFGPDRFSYTAKAPASGTASADVAVTVSARLVLKGRAVDLPANAAVTIVAGARTVHTSTDASGNYSAPVLLDSPAGMITVLAQGSGSGAHIKLISVVGDSQLAVTAAGAGAIATPENMPGLLVTSFSTSLYANAILRNGGTVPGTWQAFEYASRGVSYSELAQMASALRSLTGTAGAAPTRALPVGASDTLALALNRPLYTAFVRQIPDLNEVLEEQLLIGDTRLASLPSLGINSSKSLILHNNLACCSGPAYELAIHANGSGFFSRDGHRSAGTWRKGATMTLSLTVPEVHADLVVTPDLDYLQVEYATREITLRQYSGTSKHGFVSVTYSGTARYPNGELPDAPFELGEVWAFDDWDNATAPANLSGAVLAGLPAPIFDPVPFGTQMVVTLGSDGGASSAQYPGKLSTWSIQNGKLEIALTGISAQANTPPGNGSLRMGLVHVNPNGDERWLARMTVPTGEVLREVLIVRPQAGLSFTDANAVMSLTSEANSNAIGSRRLYTILADHSSSRDLAQRDGLTVTHFESTSWTIEGATLVMRSYRVVGSPTLNAVCPSGQVCTVESERIWTLLQSDATSITVLDSFRRSTTGPGYVVIRMSRN